MKSGFLILKNLAFICTCFACGGILKLPRNLITGALIRINTKFLLRYKYPLLDLTFQSSKRVNLGGRKKAFKLIIRKLACFIDKCLKIDGRCNAI